MDDAPQIAGTPTPHHGRKRRAVTIMAMAAAMLLASLGAYRGLRLVYESRLTHSQYAPAPKGMVLVPAGEFLMGGADGNEPHSVFLPAYYIDTLEVTNADYGRFDPTFAYDEAEADLPVTRVSKEKARAYAAWAGKRLPTSAEWEKAARGTDGRLYPWGNTFADGKANIAGHKALEPVGSYPDGASPYGALDMSGNAWEWVDDTYRDALVGSFERGIIRGGGYSYSPHQGTANYLGFEGKDLTCQDLGFRCVKDAEPE